MSSIKKNENIWLRSNVKSGCPCLSPSINKQQGYWYAQIQFTRIVIQVFNFFEKLFNFKRNA